MGKGTVFVDELVRDAFIFENPVPTVGLLIGTSNEKGDLLIAHLAQSLEEIDGDNEEVGDRLNSDVKFRPQSLSEIKLATLSHHVKQVIRMLPGGLVILGIYVVDAIDNIFAPNYEGILKSLLTVMNKSLSRNPFYGSEFGKSIERLVIHFNPTSKKFAVRIIDCQSLRSLTLETVFVRLEWAKIECEYDTFFAMHLAPADIGVPLKKNIKVLMETFQESLNSSKFIVNGKYPSTQDVFEEQLPKLPPDWGSRMSSDAEDADSEGGGGGSGSSSPRHHSSESGNDSETENPMIRPVSPIHIITDKTPGTLLATSPGQDFITHLHLHGKIATVAFVPIGSSTAFVVEMVKQDILRSLTSRIEMHCESLIEEEQGTQGQTADGATKVYHEVPRRVFANLLGSKLLVSDYLFPGEGPKDSVASFRDILSLRLDDATDIIMTKEKPFNLDDLRSKGSLEELICSVEPLATSNMASSSMTIWITIILVAVLVGVLGIFLPYFWKIIKSKDG